MELQYKSFSFEVKAISEDGDFTVYAAVFNNVDRGDDVIVPGAFRNLDAFVADGFVAVSHDASELPVATIEEATQDAHGLLVRGKFHSTECAQDCRTVVRERMERGKTVGASIGYRVVDCAYEMRDDRQIRILKGVDIFEVSFVNVPMNPLAQVTEAKSAPLMSELKALLIEVKKGKTMSKAMHAYLKSCHDSMAPAVKDLKALLDAHDPDRDRDAGDEPDDDGDGDEKSKEKANRLARARADLALVHHSPIFARVR